MKNKNASVVSLSLEEKVGQLIVVGITGCELTKQQRSSLSRAGFSGFILFKKNIESVEAARKLIKDLRSLYPKETPPILAADEEGGRVSQIGHLFSRPPSAATIGRTLNERFAFFHARDSAQKLKWLGFNVVFAPVLDINDEPKNPIIGDRAYGDDVESVVSLGIAALKGFADSGIVPVAKHFPGHGSSTVDSHKALPVIEHAAERWYTFEFAPFNAAIQAGVRIIMTGHIACPGLTGKHDVPATFSSKVVDEILRRELGYSGVVMTDALEMAAASDYMAKGGGPEEAIKAGCDLLLFAGGGTPALRMRDRVVKAVREGTLSERSIDESLKRVLALRSKLI